MKDKQKDVQNLFLAEAVERAIARVTEAYEMSMHIGYGKLHLAFSGGKDSVALYGIVKQAAERMGKGLHDIADAQYYVTSLDPPELLRFMRKEYPDVAWQKPRATVYKLVATKYLFPPLRTMRWCCKEVKEWRGEDKFVLTGVRWAESQSRAKKRKEIEKTDGSALHLDNDEDRRELERCVPHRRYVCNPIIDWTDSEVWEYIRTQGLAYCPLYDEPGIRRIGCVGCPCSDLRRDFARWPQNKKLWVRAFDQMMEECRRRGKDTWDNWQSGEQVFDWWVYHADDKKKDLPEAEILTGDLFEEDNEDEEDE